MPTILYPDVPAYPGVPALVRSANIPQGVTIALGTVQTLLANALQAATEWGIFDVNGNQLGLSSQGSNGLFTSILNSVLGSTGPILSTNAFEFRKESRSSTFQVERGSFAAYNKVAMPSTPTVTLALQGASADRTTFLKQLDAACESTNLYHVVTPEFTYYNYSIESYSLIRRSDRGATLLMAELSLLEIRQVAVAYSTVQTSITSPQNPNAVPPSNSGLVQTQPVSPSVLKSLSSLFPSLGGN